jgi:hypothetical protein
MILQENEVISRCEEIKDHYSNYNQSFRSPIITTGGTGVYIENNISSGKDIPSWQQKYARTAQHSRGQR